MGRLLLSKTEVMMADQMTVETMDEQSMNAAEDVESLLFGTGVSRQSDDEQSDERDNTDAGGEKPASESGEKVELSDEEKAEQEKAEQEAKEEKGKAEKPEPDYEALAEPLKKYLGDDIEIKSQEDYNRAVSGLIEKQTETEQALNEEVEANEKLAGLFENHPLFTKLAKTLSDNPDIDFKGGLLRVLELDSVTDVIPDKKEDPEGYADYILAKKEREKQLEASRKQEEERQNTLKSNVESSEKMIEDYRKSAELEKQDIDKIMTTAHKFAKDLGQGKVTKEFLEVMAKGLNFESAVSTAEQQGKVQGKNEAATNAKNKKAGDGLPKPKNAGGGRAPETSGDEILKNSFEMAIDQSVW